jgi:hypothetical protein
MSPAGPESEPDNWREPRARYRPQAASARLPEEAAVASNAMLPEPLGSTISCIISRSPWAVDLRRASPVV